MFTEKFSHLKNIIITLLCTSLTIMVTRGQARKDEEFLSAAKKAIAGSNAVYFESFVKNDSSIFINRYSKDGCIMAPNAPALCGREAAAKFFKKAHLAGLHHGKFITTAVYGEGKEFVTEEGLWQSFDARGNLFDDGKFLVLWKRTAEGWKMFRDSFSSNRTQ